MSVQFEFLGPLRQVVNGDDKVLVAAGTVGEALAELDGRYPGLTGRLLEPEGALHRHINIYINEEDVRFKEQLATTLKPGDLVTVISAIAGG